MEIKSKLVIPIVLAILGLFFIALTVVTGRAVGRLMNIGRGDESMNMMERAMYLYLTGNTEEAAATWREATESELENAVGHYSLGIVLQQEGDHKGAIVEFREAIRLEPLFVEAHVCMGLAQLETGQTEDALESLTHAVELLPDYHGKYGPGGMMAELEGESHDPGPKINRLIAGISARSQNAETHFELARVSAVMFARSPQDQQKAMLLKELETALKLDPRLIDRARSEESLRPLASDPDFRRILLDPPSPERAPATAVPDL